MKNTNNLHIELLGLTKKEMIAKFGDEFNFYPDNVWVYFLHRNFFFRKSFLVINFENDIVISIQTKTTYGKIAKT